MTETTLGLIKARESLSEIIDGVAHHGDAYIIQRHGRPAAAIVPMQVYEAWKQRREEFVALIRQFQASSTPRVFILNPAAFLMLLDTTDRP